MSNIQSQPGNSRASLRYLHFGKRLSFLLLISICFLCFMPSRETNTAQSAQLAQVNEFIDPEDMVEDGIYFFSDHGSGMSTVQYDRMEGNNIYTTSSITPSLSLFSGPGLWGTVSDAGAIRLATLGEILHLVQCILAGMYVP